MLTETRLQTPGTTARIDFWRVLAVASVLLASTLLSVFSPDMVTGSAQEHLPIVAMLGWFWGLVGFFLVALAFASIGVLLGAVLPSSRAAQALGVLLWFVLLILGGAGPPPEVLTGAMSTIGDLTVLRQAIEVIQDGWLSLDPGGSWLIVGAVMIVSGLLAILLFRWE